LSGSIFFLFFFPVVFIAVFRLLDDLIYGIKRLTSIKKSKLVERPFIFTHMGVFIAILAFVLVLYGMIFGRYHFKVNTITIEYDDLPSEFNGYTLVQFSDFHAGSSIESKGRMMKAFEIMNSLKPDIIVFTGDVVNMRAAEAFYFKSHFSSLAAPDGKYAILGNHDYGEYSNWPNLTMLASDHDSVKTFFKQTGFKLLLNEAVHIKKMNDSIALLGVENWGKPPFKPYGKLDDAMNAAGTTKFKILLSHDPSHWDIKVKDLTDIHLTLSGHTHGMQLGIEIGQFKWSPSSFVYAKWGGLYQNKDKEQYLYVNRGLGVIGFLARIGMRPEITVFKLKSK